MTLQLDGAIVRIFCDTGDPAGSGFLVSEKYIFTCAHVIDKALRLSQEAPRLDEECVYLDFPIVEPDKRFRARVVSHRPRRPGSQTEQDIAVLELLDNRPAKSSAVWLIQAEEIWDHSFKAFGFPAGFPSGVWASGTLRGRQANGWIQIEAVKLPGYSVQKGFSGTPVWDEHIGGVVGMVVSADKSEKSRAAFVIPSNILFESFPELKNTFHKDIQIRWREWENRLRNEIIYKDLDRRIDIVPSPLLNLWQEFIQSRQWHERLADTLEAIRELASHVSISDIKSIIGIIDKINLQDRYDHVLVALHDLINNKITSMVTRVIKTLEQDLETNIQRMRKRDREMKQEALRQARSMRNMLRSIEREIEEPRFRRCFLVMGSSGAGKTHFIAHMKQDEGDENILLLILPFSTHQSDLKGLILQQICEATGVQWSTLYDFCKFMAAVDSPIKVVIVLDNIQQWLSSRAGFQKELLSIMYEYTNLHLIYWLATIEFAGYDYIVDGREEWQKFSYFSREKLTSRSYYDSQNLEPGEDDSRRALLPISGWVLLDKVNNHDEIGIKIIREKFSSEGLSIELALDKIEGDDTRKHILSNPFISWILIDLRRDLELSQIVTFNFMDFVEHFWQKKQSLLELGFLSRHDLDLAIDIVAIFFTKKGEASRPVPKQLLKYIIDKSKDISNLDNENMAKEALRIIESSGLLVMDVTEGNDDDDNARSEEFAIHFETFWAWRIARQLLKKIPMKDGEIDGVGRPSGALVSRVIKKARLLQIKQLFDAIHLRSLSESAFEFFLLLLDRNQKRESIEPQFILEIWQLGLRPGLMPPAAVWFAGPKASHLVQKSLAAWAIENRGKTGDYRTLFAFVYFAKECSSTILNTPQRIALLQPYYSHTHKDALAPYYLFILEDLLAEIRDNDTLIECILHLFGCETMGMASDLADVTLNILLKNNQEDLINILLVIIKYLQISYRNKDFRKASRERIDTTYREWLIHKCCRYLADKRSLDAYYDLKNNGWYDPKSLNIGSPISTEMEREANIAIGSVYRRLKATFDTQPFVDFVEKLTKSEDIKDRENAYYIIRHTEITGGEELFLVDKVFHHLLRTIYLDSDLYLLTYRRHVERFFEYNLPEYKDLQNNRPTMADMQINCVMCGNSFIYSVLEQISYQSKGFDQPKRCPNCRQKRLNVTTNNKLAG